MKFKFKVQDYQTEAVESTVRIFEGQPKVEPLSYIRDLGRLKDTNIQMKLTEEGKFESLDNQGFKNQELMIDDGTILDNVRKIQKKNNIKQSSTLVRSQGRPAFDIEMETGTGKTYVFIKTMFELNKRYGWTKFIIVVPSIAIREGIKKSFDMTEDHFMEQYGKKIRNFIYDSSDLTAIDQFSSSGDIYAMIINTQAFNTSMKEGGRSKDARIIYSKRDDFGSRRPIDVIAANNPILILDEPQKMGGKATQDALKNFNPLFSLNYSATHRTEHNLIYVLDALDAYNKKLVKRIAVKGFELKNFRGADEYLYLDEIILSPNKPPKARLHLEIKYKQSINREARLVEEGDNLFYLSKEMEQYKGYTVSSINPITDSVSFTNGEVIRKGDVVGDISEKDMRRIQIRETIKSHFEKEASLYKQGIKTLSLFFIDEVAKYRQYDEDDNEMLGEYGQVFQEEYMDLLQTYRAILDKDYLQYLDSIGVEETHTGYFSIDKKGKAIDSKIKRGQDSSDDISAYDLILKNKERILSFQEPVRFIFSHSALREGWDNPNVFQICTLKHSDSQIAKRQEVGRGLRLCVNQNGDRMDKESLGELVHDMNVLTVIASDSYSEFVRDLQKDIKDNLYDRPTKATREYFFGKIVETEEGSREITVKEASDILFYLIKSDYINNDFEVTDKYHKDLENDELLPVPEDLKEMEEGIHYLVQAIFDESVLDKMIKNDHETKLTDNELNDNFYKKEFQSLWNLINNKYSYKVKFDSEELVDKAIKYIDDNLKVSKLQYTISQGIQHEELDEHAFDRLDSFEVLETKTQVLDHASISQVEYDLVGKIAEETVLTRGTIVKILKGIEERTFQMFKDNPEEFITKVTRLINSQKATMVVDHITYNRTENKYDSSIFTAGSKNKNIKNALKTNKHIQDYVFVDGISEDSVESRFAKSIDRADEVVVYAKLPKGFAIPTPVGNYTPDWAIAFKEGAVKHVYFIAETKGSLDSMELRNIEKAKIDCAKSLFNNISTDNLRYDHVTDYQSLLNIVK
jgi:type III restriction enzyme